MRLIFIQNHPGSIFRSQDRERVKTMKVGRYFPAVTADHAYRWLKYHVQE